MRYWSGAPNAHAPYRYSANPSDHVEESILASKAVKLVSPPSTNTEFIVETTADGDSSLLRVASAVWSERNAHEPSSWSPKIHADTPSTPNTEKRWVNRITPGSNDPRHPRSQNSVGERSRLSTRSSESVSEASG